VRPINMYSGRGTQHRSRRAKTPKKNGKKTMGQDDECRPFAEMPGIRKMKKKE